MVVGWKTDPRKALMAVYENPNSLHPREDVVRALELGSSLVEVRRSETRNIEDVKREFIAGYAAVARRDKEGKYADPPLPREINYEVTGFAPVGRYHPGTKEMLHRIALRVDLSEDPGRDVEKALKMGCDHVAVSVNFELTESEEREMEHETEKEAREDEEERILWENIPEFTAEDDEKSTPKS